MTIATLRELAAAAALASALCVTCVGASGLGAANHSSVCVTTESEIHALKLNEAQLKSGVEGNSIQANDCKLLVQTNVMLYRSDEEQKALCDNSCFATLARKYQTLLENKCFDNGDSDEGANGRLHALAYQIACQTTTDGKYCSASACGSHNGLRVEMPQVPMLADLVKNAGTDFDLCADIVKDMGCCFQSYRQYVLVGTAASIATLDEAQKTCTNDGVGGLDKACPCGIDNAYNKHALNGTTICSDARMLSASALLLLASVLATTTLWLQQSSGLA